MLFLFLYLWVPLIFSQMNRIRNDDHSTIGSVLFGVLTPALFWKRARAIHLVLGGAGIGSSMGLAVNKYRDFAETRPSNPGPVMAGSRPSIPVERSGGGV